MEIKKYELRLKETKVNYDLNKNDEVKTPDTAVKVFNEVLELKDRTQEVTGLICLDTKNNITGIFEISKGTLNSSLIHSRDIFQRAYMVNAGGIVLGHNHPSGNISPSGDDLKVTRKIIKGGEVLGIDVLDHLIIADDTKFTSLKEIGKGGF